MDTELNRFLRSAVPFQAGQPSSQGRPLPHPQEDVEEQGLAGIVRSDSTHSFGNARVWPRAYR